MVDMVMALITRRKTARAGWHMVRASLETRVISVTVGMGMVGMVGMVDMVMAPITRRKTARAGWRRVSASLETRVISAMGTLYVANGQPKVIAIVGPTVHFNIQNKRGQSRIFPFLQRSWTKKQVV
jgi:hypothetical protein